MIAAASFAVTASDTLAANPDVASQGPTDLVVVASATPAILAPPDAIVGVARTIAKAPQTIIFEALANKRLGDPDFTVSARASSGLAVVFAAVGRCILIGARVHLTGAGFCTIIASQRGNATFEPADPVARTFAIAPTAQPLHCRVPRVISKELGAARSTIIKARCRTGEVTRVYSRTKRRGIVIGQSRRPGQVLPANSKINLTVSRGRRR